MLLLFIGRLSSLGGERERETKPVYIDENILIINVLTK
jgi:hypothetical protein